MNLGNYFPELLESTQDEKDGFVYFSDERANPQLHVSQFGYMAAQSGYSYGPSVRDHLLIHFVISGKGEASIDETRFEVRQGQMFVIPRNVVSYYGADETTPWIYFYIGLKGGLADAVMERFREDGPSAYHREFDMDSLLPLLEEMRREMFGENGYLHLLSGAYRLVDQLSRSRSVGRAEPAGVYREKAASQISRIITKVEREFDTNLTVQQIADELGVNRSYLTEHFKRYTGYSVKGYITALRIKRAKVQLSHLQMSMQEVAVQCGYSDPLFFSRIFKKYTGYSPTEYRKMLVDGRNENSQQNSIYSQQKSIDEA